MSKSKSLASETLPVPVTSQLPALPAAPECAVSPYSSGGVPFIRFASHKSPKWAELSAALPGLHEGDPILCFPEPDDPVKLAPMKFFLWSARGYFAELSESDGEILDASWVEDSLRPALKEAVDSVILVFVGDRIIPARCTWRTTKCPAVKLAVKARDRAASPEWGKTGPDYAASLAIDQPFARFTTTVSVVERTGGKGRKYQLANGKISPASVGDYAVLKAMFADPDQRKLFDRIVEGYDRRLAEVAKFAG